MGALTSKFTGTKNDSEPSSNPVAGILGQQPTPPSTPATPDHASTGSTSIFGGTRRKRRSTKNNKTKGRINFSKIKWGSFTKIYNNYIKNHPDMKNQLPDLKHFAHYVNKHPTQFNKKTHKKALFYTNIIEK
jgi:hypothetical protein